MLDQTSVVLNGTTAKWFLEELAIHRTEKALIDSYKCLKSQNQTYKNEIVELKDSLADSLANNIPLNELVDLENHISTINMRMRYYTSLAQIPFTHTNEPKEILDQIQKVLEAKINMLPSL